MVVQAGEGEAMERERDVMPTAREMSSEEMEAKARARGESHGFTSVFLDNFIERELRMMWKWQNKARGSSPVLESDGDAI
jgi:hypothetical protein